MYYNIYNSPIGEILLFSDGENLTNLYFEKQKLSFSPKYKDNLDIFKNVKHWLDNYFARKNPEINFNIIMKGTIFQMEVWKILKLIPYGKTTTYGNIAEKIAKIFNKEKMSAQAVGRAVSLNPIPIIIPCHRVIGKNGKLVGYSGGLDIKVKLLEIERIKYNKL